MHGQVLKAANSSPRGGGSAFCQSALRWTPRPPPDTAVSSLKVPQHAVVGKLSLAKPFNTRFLLAIPYGCPSRPSPASYPARPGALHLKCHMPDAERSRSGAQVTGVSQQPAGKGSSPPISQSCITTAAAAAAAAKSLQSCPILCDPIDGSPLGSSVPGILQARILEWVAISFSNA